MFAEDVTFESTRGPIHFDPKFVYTGTLEGNIKHFVRRVVKKLILFAFYVLRSTLFFAYLTQQTFRVVRVHNGMLR